jgi:hypothetical protein
MNSLVYAPSRIHRALVVIDEHGRVVESATDAGLQLCMHEGDEPCTSSADVCVHVDEHGELDAPTCTIETTDQGLRYSLQCIDLALVGLARAEGASSLEAAASSISNCPDDAGPAVRELHAKWRSLIASGQEPRVW